MSEEEKGCESIESSLDSMVKEHGGGIVGIVRCGSFSRYFNMSLGENPSEQLLRDAFSDGGKHIAMSYRKHKEKENNGG